MIWNMCNGGPNGFEHLIHTLGAGVSIQVDMSKCTCRFANYVKGRTYVWIANQNMASTTLDTERISGLTSPAHMM